MILSNFDIDSDFYSDPEIKLLFKEEHKAKVPSKIMWALTLNVHPKSKFGTLDSESREMIIKKDYLNDEEFKFTEYAPTTDKIKKYLLTQADRSIHVWGKKLEEVEKVLDATPITMVNCDEVLKILKDLHGAMKQYKEVVKEFQREQEMTAFGGAEESLTEKMVI